MELRGLNFDIQLGIQTEEGGVKHISAKMRAAVGKDGEPIGFVNHNPMMVQKSMGLNSLITEGLKA